MSELFLVLVIAGFVVGTFLNGAIAGHNYHGYGMKMTEMIFPVQTNYTDFRV
jgi:hypothetical protein